MKEKESLGMPHVKVSLPRSYWNTLSPEQQESLQSRLDCGVPLSLTGLTDVRHQFIIDQTVVDDIPQTTSGKPKSGRRKRG